ncbi:hypothetical protein AABB24_031040 [Solanum stoloniferum]|uniref:Uncharacterized protein n=1 Tax=Solanum stoloniferum TaxID=62892 RepID=A0ABD2RRU9_9SOLN
MIIIGNLMEQERTYTDLFRSAFFIDDQDLNLTSLELLASSVGDTARCGWLFSLAATRRGREVHRWPRVAAIAGDYCYWPPNFRRLLAAGGTCKERTKREEKRSRRGGDCLPCCRRLVLAGAAGCCWPEPLLVAGFSKKEKRGEARGERGRGSGGDDGGQRLSRRKRENGGEREVGRWI